MLMQENKNLPQLVWGLLRPRTEEFIAYVGIGVALAAVAVFLLASNGSLGADSESTVASIKQLVHNVAELMSGGDLWARFLLFGFWFIVGTISYFTVWFLINLAVDAYNDIVISTSFVHPRSFHQSDFWLSIIGRAVVRGSAAIALGFYTVFWFLIAAPLGIGAVQNILINTSLLNIAERLFFFGILILTTTHVAVILLRLVLLKPDLDKE